MKCAAIILAHERPDCLSRLLTRLSGPLWQPYVHVDATSDMAQFEHLRPKAKFLEDRIAVHWGHVSIVDATLKMLRQALQDKNITHLVLLSGRCFPARPDKEIATALLSCTHGGNFIDQNPMPNAGHKLGRITKSHFRYIRSKFLRRLMYHLRKWRIPAETKHLLATTELKSGSNWMILSREACEKILRLLEDEPWFRPAFERALCPDEFFFHTAFHFLELKPDGPSQTYSRIPDGTANAVSLKKADWDDIRRTGNLFARKTDVFFPEETTEPDFQNRAS
ncbi:beta-1,6-N-acetylglucosaminyltransferase [Actibacterium pelagium]|nr:beta-1,6-N-acetylglucosaminyltransferase [Actibacterium pelagium]